MSQKLKLGMVGGGPGSFIGAIHRIAARIDNHYDLTGGAFSSSLQKSLETGRELGLDERRIYPTYQDLISEESRKSINERIQVIAIATPNHLHFEPAKLAMQNGFHVILDKPIAFSLAEAKLLQQIAEETGQLLCLTHTYTGYPMVKEAKQQIAEGKLGKIRKVYVEYPQGWLSKREENGDNKQAAWRTDPNKSGMGGAIGDIGTHAFNLAEYISGLKVTQINADINTAVEGRKLDDDVNVLLKFDNNASGILFATQVAAGEENNIKVRVYGDKGGLEWQQNDANSLVMKFLDQPYQTLRTGSSYLGSFAKHNTRTPAGHTEGYLEAFANLYRNFALTIKAKLNQETPTPEMLDYTGIEDGVRGMAFIEQSIASSQSNQKWIDFIV